MSLTDVPEDVLKIVGGYAEPALPVILHGANYEVAVGWREKKDPDGTSNRIEVMALAGACPCGTVPVEFYLEIEGRLSGPQILYLRFALRHHLEAYLSEFRTANSLSTTPPFHKLACTTTPFLKKLALPYRLNLNFHDFDRALRQPL